MPIIFIADHETGNTLQYDTTSGADLSVAAGAAIKGSYGLNVLIDDATADYAQKTIDSATGTARFRFYFDPNGIAFNDYAGCTLLIVTRSNTGDVAKIYFQYHNASGNIGNIWARYVDDAIGNHDSGNYTITDELHYIEFLITKSDGSNNGVFTLWIDGTQRFTTTTWDNDTRLDEVHYVQIGGLEIGAGYSGTIFLDDLVINNDGSAIGSYEGSSSSSTSISSSSSSSSTSSSSTSSSTSIPAEDVAWGEEYPMEVPVSWTKWDDGAMGAIGIVGDPDWGKMQLVVGQEGRSDVRDFGNSSQCMYTVVNNKYGIGSGIATIQIRGSGLPFAQDAVNPVWHDYTTPFTAAWRYVQVRIVKIS